MKKQGSGEGLGEKEVSFEGHVWGCCGPLTAPGTSSCGSEADHEPNRQRPLCGLDWTESVWPQ